VAAPLWGIDGTTPHRASDVDLTDGDGRPLDLGRAFRPDEPVLARRNIARYINHSCKPNAEADVRKHTVFIAATRTIHPGDEITYNYGKDYFDTFIKPHGCRCMGCKQKTAVKRSAARAAAKRRKRRRSKKRS